MKTFDLWRTNMATDKKLRPHLNSSFSRLLEYGCRDRGDYDKAVKYFTEAIRLKPNDASAYTKLGNVYCEKGDYDQAIANYTKAIGINPDHANKVYNCRGIAYRFKGKYDQAIADFTEAIRIDPDNAAVYKNRGDVYCDRGGYDRAAADFTEAIRLKPNDAATYKSRGDAYASQEEYNKAIADFTKAIRLNPYDAAAYDNRGDAYIFKLEYDRMLADYFEAIRLNPDDAVTCKTYTKVAERFIRGLKFVLTASVCPEQYDVFDKNNKQVGYVWLRWGGLECDYPECGEETIYTSHSAGSVEFDDDYKRYYHLNKIAQCIKIKIGLDPHDAAQIFRLFRRYNG
jgi:tetratricopeptide (TPR) repeat protein